jgi:sporulation protein YabP
MAENRYQIIMTNREHIVIEGVEHVASFDEEEIILETKMGILLLKGENLHIVQLNLEDGNLIVEGHCKAIDFTDEKAVRGLRGKSKSFLNRLLK